MQKKFQTVANNVLNQTMSVRSMDQRNRVLLTTDDGISDVSGNGVSNHIDAHRVVQMGSGDELRGGSEFYNDLLITDQIGVAKVETATADVVINEYPADCFPDSWYTHCPSCTAQTPFMLRWKELRYKSYMLVENKYFETICITLILVSSMTLVGMSNRDTKGSFVPSLMTALFRHWKMFT